MSYFKRPVTKQCTAKILEQMNNSFFVIKERKNDTNICFFCKISYKNKKIPVIIINKYLIDLEFTNSIFISINNRPKEIKFGRTRFINKDLSLYIIEIVDNKIENVNFLDIDNKIYEEETEMFYNKESIYIIQINNKKEKVVSYGILNNLHKNQIFYSCNLSQNCKNFYIFNLSNNKLIGMNNTIHKDSNKGIFLKYVINQFINIYKHNLKMRNEINLLIKVDEKDILQKIYINDDLTKLNKLNTELYINDELNEYNNYFKPEKEGKYIIKLKIYINLTDCSHMFARCKNITDINFVRFNTENVTDMNYMFYECNNLTAINNLSSFDTKNITNMTYMFYGCKNLKDINLSFFNTKNVTNMNYMFYGCKNLKDINLSPFNTKNVTYAQGMFCDCSKNIINSNISHFKQFKIKDLIEINNQINMIIDVNKNDINKEIYFLDLREHYQNNNLKELIDLNTKLYINDKNCKFNKCFKPEKEGKYKIKLEFHINLTNCSFMFAGCKNITEINFIHFNTSNVTNMRYMFYNCNNLRTINNLSSFHTENVINMSYMFYGCNNINDLNLSSFNFKNVTNMVYTFYGCNNIKNLNLSSFNIIKITDINELLKNCPENISTYIRENYNDFILKEFKKIRRLFEKLKSK